VLSTFLIALREGVEASLIIGILVAYLKKSNHEKSLIPMWLGVGVAATMSLVFGAVLTFTSAELPKHGEELFAGTTSIAAVVLVTFMVFWMRASARGMKAELQGKIDAALPLGSFAISAAAFFAVARESLETALLVFSNFKSVSKDSAPSVGLILGLISAILLGVAIYRRSVKINLSKFFTITGSALIIIAAGVLSHGLNEFQNLGWLPGLKTFAWNWKGANSFLSTVLDGTIGIGTSITWLQLLAWAVYSSLTLKAYLKKPAITPELIKA
jgi:high-affinity iron transporter